MKRLERWVRGEAPYNEAKELSMLGKWTEILPLFVVRWLALRYCERVPYDREGNARTAAVARPDVLVRVPPVEKRGKDELQAG